MKITKAVAYSLAILIYTLFVLHLQPVTDLEIYTSTDIYYINGLTVTTEATNEILIFDDKEALKVFISDITAKQIK